MAQERFGLGRSRSAIFFSATAALALVVLAGGCERDAEKADASVEQKIAAADSAMAYHPGAVQDDLKQANKAVDAAQSAVNESGASDIGKAEAQIELAIAETNLARINQGQVDTARAVLGNTLSRMDTLSTLISAIGQGIAADQKFQPVAAQQSVTDQIASVQGAADKPVWQPHATAPIPSLAALSSKISGLNNDIEGLQTQRKQLAADQADAATTTAELSDQADKAKGQDAVDLYKQAADSRKTAMSKGAQMELIDGQLQPMQQQLELAENEQTSLKSVVDAMQKTNSDMTDGWKKAQAAIDAQTARLKDFVDGSGGADARTAGESTDTVNALADQWVKQDKDLQGLRTTTADQLNKAKASLAAATRLYENIQKAYRDQKAEMPDAVQANAKGGAWSSMIDLANPGRLHLRLAGVEQSLADLYQGAVNDSADEARALDQLTKALATGQLTVPDALSSLDFAKEQKDNTALAESAFKSAESDLGNASVMSNSDLSRGDASDATAAKVLETFDHGQFEVNHGDEATGETLIADAKKQLLAIQQANGQMPGMLPGALMPEAPAAPAGGAAPTPATQPSAG